MIIDIIKANTSEWLAGNNMKDLAYHSSFLIIDNFIMGLIVE
jgi:hypothetical protein